MLFGLSAADAVGRTAIEIDTWRLTPDETATIDQLHSGDFFVLRTTVVDRGGRPHALRVSVTVAADKTGRDEILFAWTPTRPNDTVHRREVNALDSMAGPFALVELFTSSLVTHYCSPAFQTRLGHRVRDLIGRPAVSTVHPDDRLVWQRTAAAALADPAQSHYIEVRRQGPDGTWRMMGSELTNLIDHPQVEGIVCRSHDITELRAKRPGGVAVEQTLRSILHNSVEAIWIIDQDDATLFVNGPMVNLLGGRAAALSDYDIGHLFPSGSPLGPEHRYPGSRRHDELPFVQGNGSTRWLSVNVVPRFDEAGQYSGAIVLCADITEHRTQHRHLLTPEILGDGLVSVGARSRSRPKSDSNPPAAAALLAKLSSREQTVVSRLLNGDRVPEIARTLYVSQSTVRNQLASVFRKAGVGSQQELLRLLKQAESTPQEYATQPAQRPGSALRSVQLTALEREVESAQRMPVKFNIV
jgi:PAS domain S-box-containing protein